MGLEIPNLYRDKMGSLQGESCEDDDDYANSEGSWDNDSSDGGDGSGDAVSGDEESMEVLDSIYASLFGRREGIGQKNGAQQI